MVSSPAGLTSNTHLVLVAVVVLTVSLPVTTTANAGKVIPPYTNHTVGGEFGWHFDTSTNVSATNYTSWSSSLSFFLGDFLIFNTDSNSTVIQTYNTTTYSLCSLEQDYGNLTSQFIIEDTGDKNTAGGIPVPLTREGVNYYFSSFDNGFQCRKGMRFHIVVQHGNGVLSVPSPPSPPPSTVEVVTEQSPPPGNGGGGPLRWRFWFGLLLIWVFFP